MSVGVRVIEEPRVRQTLFTRNGLADRVYRAAEFLQEPFYFFCNGIIGRLKTVLTPGQFGNYENPSLEKIRRLFLFCISPAVGLVALPCAILTVPLNFLADTILGNQPYLRLPGMYRGEKKETFATFNMSTLLPPMTLIDGVEDSDKRRKAIAEMLRDFHFVCGQEVNGSSARFFADELRSDFREFYTYLGKSNTPLLSSGLFFAAKEKVRNVFVVPFEGSTQKAIKRLLVIFELENFSVATTHLDGGQQNPIHLQEIQQIKTFLSQVQKPVILCGDFNEDRYSNSEAYKVLTGSFVDCIADAGGRVETCTDALKIDRFAEQVSPTELSIDYATYNRNQSALRVEFVGLEKRFEVSDHCLVKCKILLKNTS